MTWFRPKQGFSTPSGGTPSSTTTGYKEPVRVATVNNIPDTATSAPLNVDGVALVAGDRVLVRAQTTQAENGIYQVITPGTGADGVWARAPDANSSAEFVAGFQVVVREGSQFGDVSEWFFDPAPGAFTLDTSAVVFVQQRTITDTQTLVAADSPYTVINSDQVILLDCSAGPITVNLPAAATRPARQLSFLKVDGTANFATIARAGADTINGATSLVLEGQYDGAVLQSDGIASWNRQAQTYGLSFGDLDLFGDGSDGDVVIAGTTTLARDMWYDNLTITATGILHPLGYRIFVRNVLEIQVGGRIEQDGNDAAGATQGAGNVATSTIGGPTGAGGAGRTAAGVGNAGAASGASGGVGSGNDHDGGAGGGSGINAGGAGGNTPILGAARGDVREGPQVVTGFPFSRFGSNTVLDNGSGGGGGGGDGAGGANVSGGGGGGGMIVLVCARVLINNGRISARGGAGGNAGPGAGNLDNAGGGGGGGGGHVFVTTALPLVTGTIDAAGGAGGTAVGTGVAGSAGENGVARVYLVRGAA